jgi:hypothetical protein
MSSLGLAPGAGLTIASVPQTTAFTSSERSNPRERQVTPVPAATLPETDLKPAAEHIARLRTTLRAIADNLAPGAKLVIRPDAGATGGAGQYIYEFIDPSSGAIIRQFPQQDLYEIMVKQKLNPAPGSFLDSKI